MSSWIKECGCNGGSDCSYDSWFGKCGDYPNCVYGIEEAKIELANRRYNLPTAVAKRREERARKRLIEDADKQGAKVTWEK